jgi:hypothetical protein
MRSDYQLDRAPGQCIPWHLATFVCYCCADGPATLDACCTQAVQGLAVAAAAADRQIDSTWTHGWINGWVVLHVWPYVAHIEYN